MNRGRLLVQSEPRSEMRVCLRANGCLLLVTFLEVHHLSIRQVDSEVKRVVRPVIDLATFDSVVRLVSRDVLPLTVRLDLVLIVTIPNANGRLVTSFVEVFVQVTADFGAFRSNLHINMSIEPSRQIGVHANNPLVIVGHVHAMCPLRNFAASIAPPIDRIVVSKVGSITERFRKLFATNTRRGRRVRVSDGVRVGVSSRKRRDRKVIELGIRYIPENVVVFRVLLGLQSCLLHVVFFQVTVSHLKNKSKLM